MESEALTAGVTAPEADDSLSIRTAVRDALAEANISQSALAEHLSLSQQAVSRRVLGQVPFTVRDLIATAALIGVPLTQLLREPETAEVTA
jgi:transcriptional regulator with XRE-family HTH domain